jgi:hypothetical protein
MPNQKNQKTGWKSLEKLPEMAMVVPHEHGRAIVSGGRFNEFQKVIVFVKSQIH